MFADIDINVYVGDITPNDGVPSFVRPAFDEHAFIAEVRTIHFDFNRVIFISLISYIIGSFSWKRCIPSVGY